MNTATARAATGLAPLLRSHPRALPMFLAGIVARLPLSVGGVALVLGVGGTYGSYAFAGLCAATTVAVGAVAGPVLARWMQRAGQRRVLLVTAAGSTAAWSGIAAACAAQVARPLLVGACGLAGAFATDIGSTVRARWAGLLGEAGAVRAAYLLESFADEATFVAGPVLVTFVGAAAPALAPAVVAIGPLLGWTTLAALRSTIPPHGLAERQTTAPRPRVRRTLGPLVAALVVLGAFLSTIEVLLVALEGAAGHPQYAGLALAGWAAGSAGAALAAASWLSHVPAPRMLLGGVVIMAAVAALLPLSGHPAFTIAVCTVAGVGAAPAIGAGFSLASATVGAGSRTEAMAWLATGLAAGTTIGAALAGVVADGVGGARAYVLCAVLGVAVVAVTVLADRASRTEPG